MKKLPKSGGGSGLVGPGRRSRTLGYWKRDLTLPHALLPEPTQREHYDRSADAMTRKITETTPKARLSDAPVGSLVPMPRGGALRNGGTNRGGSGRPPESIRARSRDMYDHVLDQIESRDLSTATLGELALIANTVARYGGLATAHDEATKPRATTVRVVYTQEPLPIPRIASPPTPSDTRER
ncbi:MAG: hypothetical protein NTW72_13725 [Gemmatimonadetes bacterium]|nr:hypothetical protein [Gemmatimonadota bacterium]